MPNSKIYYVGDHAEVASHVKPLEKNLVIEILPTHDVAKRIQAGDLCIFLNEAQPWYRQAITQALARGAITVLALDGIFEWRSVYQQGAPLAYLRPVLCHKVCCIGLSQAQILSLWGNGDKIEVVGLPRLDALHGRKPRDRKPGEPFRILVMTAKNPGFTHQQIQTTQRSLQELKQWFEAHTSIESTHHESTPTQSTHGESTPTQSTHGESTPIEVVWRLTQDMAERIGVENALKDTTGTDLAAALETADAVITTPSTSMLEAMLQGLPTALLDFHNTPQMAPACWHLSSREHFDTLIPELIKPPTEKLLHQKFLLKQHLQTGNATARMVELVESMQRIGHECLAAGQGYSFPAQILPRQEACAPAENEDQIKQLEFVAREQQQILEKLRRENNELRGRLARFENHPVVGRLVRWQRARKGGND